MAKIAFVDVDTQFDFMNPKGSLYVPGSVEIIPNLKKLMEAARKYGVPIVGSVDAHTPNDPEFEEFPPHCVKGTPGWEKIPETTLDGMRIIPMDASPDDVDLSPPGPVILEKKLYSLGIFDSIHAKAAIKATGADCFAVFGVATDYCVAAAARGLADIGYSVLLVNDAIRAIDRKAGGEIIEELTEKGVRVVTTKELLAEVAG